MARIGRLVSCLLFIALGPATAAEILVSIDRSDIAVNESFNVLFSASGNVDDDPDFAPLETDFEILSRSGSPKSPIVAADRGARSEWRLTLMPRRQGRLRIPAIAFGTDQSKAQTIVVSKERRSTVTDAADVFLESEVDTERTWVGAPVILTIRLLHEPELRRGRLLAPVLDDDDAVIDTLGQDRKYHTTRGDRRYFVVERRFRIVPYTHGLRRINPVAFEGQKLPPPTRADPYQRRGQAIRVLSPPLTFQVLPVPPAFSESSWLPARRLTLTERWSADPSSLAPGVPITRTLILAAEGLRASQLPELTAPIPESVQQYRDTPRLSTEQSDSGVVGVREEKLALVGKSAGTIELPEMRLNWFNTETGQPEVARIAARPLIFGSTTLAESDVMPSAVDLLLPGDAGADTDEVWKYVSVVTTAGWLLTAIAWFHRTRRKHPAARGQGAHPEPVGQRAALRHLEACADGDAEAAERALLAWAGTIWPGTESSSLGRLARAMKGEAAAEIRRLEAARYSERADTDWRSADLVAAIRHWQPPKSNESNVRRKLRPLHPPLNDESQRSH